jgi:hypothetical protein
MDMVRLLVRVMLVHVGMGMGMSDRAVGMHVMVELPLPPSMSPTDASAIWCTIPGR